MGIEVQSNEGGVTKYIGGWRWFIIPAGICSSPGYNSFQLPARTSRSNSFPVHEFTFRHRLYWGKLLGIILRRDEWK